MNNRLNRLPAAFILLPMTMKRVVFVSLVLMFSASTERPYSAAVSSEAMAATLLSPASATLFAAAAVFWKACVSSPRLRMNFCRLLQRLRMGHSLFHVRQMRARNAQQILADGQVVYVAHADIPVA